MKNLTQLQKQYRKLCAQARKIDQQKIKVQQQIDALNNNRTKMIHEIKETKSLIDYCVITGQNPIQAKLSRTQEEISHFVEQHLQQFGYQDQFLFTSSLITPTITAHNVYGNAGNLLGNLTTNTTTYP